MDIDVGCLRRSDTQRNCQFIPFPMARRIGKIREVAAKMLQKHSDRHAAYYREQVTNALLGHFEKIHLAKVEHKELVEAFWSEVEREMSRQSVRRPRDPNGAA